MGYYGIDLGTSNCLVAKLTQNLDDSFDVKCLKDMEGNIGFPSVVSFENEFKYSVGFKAAASLYTKSNSTIELVKLRLGKTDAIPIKCGDISFVKTPQEITSYILKHINTLHNNEVSEAVITVPAFFDQSQKDATMQSGRLAQMDAKLLVEEPTAAIVYHIFSEYKKNQLIIETDQDKNILVFDFGGGTLDLSLINIQKTENDTISKVLAIGGDTKLGGSLIDLIFTKFIISFLEDEYSNDQFILDVAKTYNKFYSRYIKTGVLSFDPDCTEESKQFIIRLKRNLERVKIELSTEDSVTIFFERQYEPLPMTRASFEKYVLQSDELNIREKIEMALNSISNQRKVVDEVLLIGGSSQIPYITEIIFNTFEDMKLDKNRIYLSNDFEEAVAKGAAIQAAINQGVKIPPFIENKCDSIVAREIMVEHLKDKITFIEKGTPYPFTEKKQLNLKIRNALSESVGIDMFEVIEYPTEKRKRLISQIQFYLPIYYTNDDITLRMNINEAGLYQIEAIYESTNETVELEVKKKFALSEQQIDEIFKQIEKSVEMV